MASNDTSLAQPTVAQQTQPSAGQSAVAQQGQVPPGQPTQPVVYQMAPGQPQPVFVQVPAGQPSTTQPIQYNYVPTAQPVQPGQPEYPMQPGQPGYPVQPGQPGYPVQPGQPGYPVQAGQPGYPVQAGQPGYPVQPGQPVHPVQAGQPVKGYPVPGQPVYAAQAQQQPGSGMSLSIDSNLLKSPLCYIKIGEFITLLAAWASLLRYLDAFPQSYYDEKADLFKGITIFCWVMVILFLVMYTFSIDKLCGCNNRPSTWTLTIFITYFVLSSLLLACSGNLVPRAVDWGKLFDRLTDEQKSYIVGLFLALAFGFLSWILFIVDLCLIYKKFQEQRAQEAPPDQGPGQPRVWDIDSDFLSSAAFKVKIAEIVTLLLAWAFILKYVELYRILGTADGPNVEDEKANFFKGITIFAWVMVILLLLTFVFSLGRLCRHRSHWTLTAIIIYLVLAVLLVACSGNLVPRAIDLGKDYDQFYDIYKPNIMALFIGLGFGIISWFLFIADIGLLYKIYKSQKAQELHSIPQSAPGQQHPAMYPGQQVVISPGQQGLQPPEPALPAYDQK